METGGNPTYCASCGAEVDTTRSTPRRFGESFCSEAHAETFVAAARAARLAVAARAAVKTDGAEVPGRQNEKGGARGWDLKHALKMAFCLGTPLIAVAFLIGGGGALLGAGAAVLPYVALLACPLAMFFMMRGMHGHAKGDGESEHSAGSSHADRS
jgi:acetyl-CoA carboxylase alpha subunit